MGHPQLWALKSEGSPIDCHSEKKRNEKKYIYHKYILYIGIATHPSLYISLSQAPFVYNLCVTFDYQQYRSTK